MIQAKDISTEDFLAAIPVAAAVRGAPDWADRWMMAEVLDMPEKVVLAKAKRLVRKGVIYGCECGCRGDFELIPEKDKPVVADG